MLSEQEHRVLQQLELELARADRNRWPRRVARALRLPLPLTGILVVLAAEAASLLSPAAAQILLVASTATAGWQLRRSWAARRLNLRCSRTRPATRNWPPYRA